MAHARPDVRQFLMDLMAELTQNYDIPGIQFDRASHPQLDCGYDDIQRNNMGESTMRWRRPTIPQTQSGSGGVRPT